MATRHEKMTRKPKKTKAKSEPQHFEYLAQKLFKVPKTETDPTAKKD